MKSEQTKTNQITTDDLAFSAFLKTKGYPLIRSDQKRSKSFFTFELSEDEDRLRLEFVNSEFVRFYNELRNLKKLLSTG